VCGFCGVGAVNDQQIADALGDVADEARRACARFGDFMSGHELASVLREEFEEFWETVRRDEADADELIQLAAVAVRGAAQIRAGGLNR